jgi:hypothetical protein
VTLCEIRWSKLFLPVFIPPLLLIRQHIITYSTLGLLFNHEDVGSQFLEGLVNFYWSKRLPEDTLQLKREDLKPDVL